MGNGRETRPKHLPEGRLGFNPVMSASPTTVSAHLCRPSLSVQTGIGVPHISGKQIESFQFRLPSLDEQEAIAVRLHDLQRDCERLSLIYQQKENLNYSNNRANYLIENRIKILS